MFDKIYQFFGSWGFKIVGIEFDDNHDNEYLHTLNYSVMGIDTATADLIKNDLLKQGFIDSTNWICVMFYWNSPLFFRLWLYVSKVITQT